MIPITKAIFDESDFALIQEPLKSGWVVQGPYVKEFEEQFAAFTKAKHAIATTSCTTALHIAVTALGLSPGDEVIVPAFTWIATANCVEYMGAKPVFVDIDLRTFNLDPAKLEQAITVRTRGIIPVHLFGLPADMDAVMEVAKRYNLWVVEDAACGFDSWYKGRHVGTFGEMGAFSFHPRKAITTGEGGMITTNESSLDTLSRTLRDHGASRSDLERHKSSKSFLLAQYQHLGYNFRMTDIQGALGVAQMGKAEWIMSSRREGAARYDEALKGLEWLSLPYQSSDVLHGYQSYVCLYRPELASLEFCSGAESQRNTIMERLEARGIVTRQGTHAAAHLDFYARKYRIRPEDFPAAYIAERLSVTLPLFAGMTSDETHMVCDALQVEHSRFN